MFDESEFKKLQELAYYNRFVMGRESSSSGSTSMSSDPFSEKNYGKEYNWMLSTSESSETTRSDSSEPDNLRMFLGKLEIVFIKQTISFHDFKSGFRPGHKESLVDDIESALIIDQLVFYSGAFSTMKGCLSTWPSSESHAVFFMISLAI